MRELKIVSDIIDHIKYYNSTVFDAIIHISENTSLDVEDILKMLDENLLCQLKEECIKERKVIKIKPKRSIDMLF